jgi:hypothetical protein
MGTTQPGMLLNPLSVWCSEKEKRFLGATLGFLDWAPTADFFRVRCGQEAVEGSSGPPLIGLSVLY